MSLPIFIDELGNRKKTYCSSVKMACLRPFPAHQGLPTKTTAFADRNMRQWPITPPSDAAYDDSTPSMHRHPAAACGEFALPRLLQRFQSGA
ncbi:hypothetical protein J8I26_03830 [Herbaspirillum sp. LeCh32-8]|nr:hypothetical protein [Herbaspirillum sp. LeCh32-8]